MTSPDPAHSSSAGIAGWRIILRLLAGFVAMGAFAYWAAAGANQGWTKTQVPVKKMDDITQIEYVEYQKRFVPGIELLGAGVALGVLMAGVTFLPRRK